MADLTDIQAAQSVKIVGSDSSGLETSAITSREDGAGKVGLSVELSSTNYVYSANNSTSVNLAANATFTGPVEDAIYQQALSVLCFSDQPGILTVNQYIDEAGLQNISQQVINITGGVGFTDAPVMNGNYFNVTFTNTGLVTTTNFAINIYQGTIPRPIVQNNPVNDYLLNVQRKKIAGHSNVSITGYNPTTGTSKEMLWSQSGTYTWKTTSAICTLSSSSASDTAAGIGARVIIIYGLDINYNEISEVVTLNGVVEVSTTLSYFRVNSIKVVEAGTNQTNVGNITMTHTGTIIQYINVGDSLSQACFYTIPAGYEVFVLSGYVRCSKADMSADLYSQLNGVKYKILKFDIASSEFVLTIRAPYEIQARSDVWIETAAATGSISASGFLEMIQIKRGY